MKAYCVCTAGGPMVVLTECDSVDDPGFLGAVRAKGYSKFIIHELPLDAVRARYGTHFEAVCQDPHEDDSLRVLDYTGQRAYRSFSFDQFGSPLYYEMAPDGTESLWSYQETPRCYHLSKNPDKSYQAVPAQLGYSLV